MEEKRRYKPRNDYGCCPYCKGTGKLRIERRMKQFTQEQIEKALKYKGLGYTLREIAREINVSHPQTVSNLLRYYD
jgi:DnaJ-class molecular chaperone